MRHVSVLPQRRPDGTLLPGASLNPGGRPRIVVEIQKLARSHTPEAIARLAELMKSPDEKVALVAIDQMLDRAWGKPVQQSQSDVRKLDLGSLYLAALKDANGIPASDAAKIIDGCETAETSDNEDGAARSSDDMDLESISATPSVEEW